MARGRRYESYCGTEDECGTFYEHLSTGLVIYLMFQSSCCLCVALCCTAACCFPRSSQKAPGYGGSAGQTFSREQYGAMPGEVREDTIPLTQFQGEYEEGVGPYQPIY
mmetsp:Transcript_2391/g.3308  ORF Transcript_2391/g.3308 Transcript_2391/m.3308 type:complete len:108 (-) Transcript_2391:70-393(-)